MACELVIFFSSADGYRHAVVIRVTQVKGLSYSINAVDSRLFRGRTARANIGQLHKARHPLAEYRIRHPDHGCVAYRRMGHQDAFDFNRGDIRTTANNWAGRSFQEQRPHGFSAAGFR